MDSILTSIKKMLGIDEGYSHFDYDILMHINTVLFILAQAGVGPEEGFIVTSDKEQWSDFVGESKRFEAVKTYVFLKVKMAFDPPTSSFVLDSMKTMAQELEWRLNINAETEV